MEAELIFCEDTRVTKTSKFFYWKNNLLDFQTKNSNLFHSHNEKDILKIR